MRIIDYGSTTFGVGRNNQLFTRNVQMSYTPPVSQRVMTNLNVLNRVNQNIASLNARTNGEKAATLSEEYRKVVTSLGTGANTSATNSLNNYYEQSGIKVDITSRSSEDLSKELVQANNDLAWAKVQNDQAGMAAASQVAANLRALG